ncbi:MAG: HAMP domain-containing sensor histidine kinase [Planctomycetota bacterium]
MFERRSLRLPITLGVILILSLAALIVGWVLVNVYAADNSPKPSVYWTLLTVGSILFGVVLVGVVFYLTLSVKAINLNRRQSNFIDSVTHELKSPIASLKLYLQTMKIRNVSEEEQAKFHQIMMDDVERLDSLISHLLDAGTIEKKKSREDYSEVPLDELLVICAKRVCSRYRVDPEVIELNLKPCSIYASHVDATMIFRNLLDNAVKYAGDPPKVHVNMRLEGEIAVVEICDNGEGIPRSLRRKVFGRFVRLGEELRRKKPGTGLGLYIVRTLVRRLNGKVAIVERDRRFGTVFEVRLPIQDRDSLSGEHPLPVETTVNTHSTV